MPVIHSHHNITTLVDAPRSYSFPVATMRLTRSQRRAESEIGQSTDVHTDNTATESISPSSTSDEAERVPLKEIKNLVAEIPVDMPAKKGKKGKKAAAKGKKAKKDQVDDVQTNEQDTPEVLEDEREAAASPASEAAAETLSNDPELQGTCASHAPERANRIKSPC